MHYYGTRLSENISRREPEGYLLCLNVPVARTGTQEYWPEELGLPGGDAPVPVYRPEEEVFSPETLASFEGMPVTNNHPPDGVDIENIRRLQAGHAHNVRRGGGEESDLVLADLIITDPVLIDAILAGKREISCGYNYELHEENGQYIQRKIRGNHIAVVDAGRAGSRVSIKDHKPERRTAVMKKSLSKMLARMAKDGDVEAVAEFIGELIEETPAETTVEVPGAAQEPAPETVTVETPENQGVTVTVDEESVAGILERLDKLIALLSAAAEAPAPASDDDPAGEVAEVVEEVLEAATEEPLPAETPGEIAEMVEAIIEPAVSTTLEETQEGDCDDPEKAATADALRSALAAFRPALARMSRSQRRRVCADIAAGIRRKQTGKDSRYAALAARRTSAQAAPSDLGRRIMAARNPHYKSR